MRDRHGPAPPAKPASIRRVAARLRRLADTVERLPPARLRRRVDGAYALLLGRLIPSMQRPVGPSGSGPGVPPAPSGLLAATRYLALELGLQRVRLRTATATDLEWRGLRRVLYGLDALVSEALGGDPAPV